VLTTYAGEGQAARALRAGASGYLLKSSLRREMIEVIRSVHGGARHVDARLATKLAFPSDELALGDRESEVLRLIAVGNSNRAVAGQLGISEETVKTHLKASLPSCVSRTGHMLSRKQFVAVFSRFRGTAPDCPQRKG
jgi:DNA-binding NarL/FixJ family response regulator